MTAEPVLDELRLRRLIDAGRSLIAKLDVEAVLQQLLDVAREVTGARYAAVGVLDKHREELERFVTAGIDPETHRAIGDLPRGRGILGLLIEDPRPLRLEHIGDHPTPTGSRAAIRRWRPSSACRSRSAKRSGATSISRRRRAVNRSPMPTRSPLSSSPTGPRSRSTTRGSTPRWSSGAITWSAPYAGSTLRWRSHRRSAGETNLNRILELIVKRARALVGARTLVIMLEQETELVVAAGAGELPEGVNGQRMAIEGTVTGRVLRSQKPERLTAARSALTSSLELLHLDADAALIVPLAFRGRAVGVLAAYDRIGEEAGFDREDERLLGAFAASAATAVATGKSVEEQRLRQSIEASEQERRRWARELHERRCKASPGCASGCRGRGAAATKTCARRWTPRSRASPRRSPICGR